jgi:uncharacterized repeat protein (TIGR02543 family)
VTPTYTVTFNSNGGSTVAPIADIANAAKVTLPAPPTKAGYIFAGWNTAEDGTGATFDGTSTITANLTVYAQWTAETYTVTFNSNGGSAVAPIADVEKAATVTLPAAPTKSGFVFAGWNTAEAGTGSIFDGDTYVTANITVYAQWTAQPELTSSVKHGIYVGGRITLTPNIDGGTWNWDEDFFTATFNSPATFTALKAGTTKITYSVEGGTVTYDVTIEAGILPATGQYFVNFFTGLGTLALATVILTGICKKRKKA